MDLGVRKRLLEHGIVPSSLSSGAEADIPGLDDKIASHIAHLFIRDPLVQFSETVEQDDSASMDHFENIQSTNWQTIRFKPPPVNSPIGWRVEFRSMEIQMTDFENAAFSVFIVLLTRAIISFDLNFYMPISLVSEDSLPCSVTIAKTVLIRRWTKTCNGHRRKMPRGKARSTSDAKSSPLIAHRRDTISLLVQFLPQIAQTLLYHLPQLPTVCSILEPPATRVPNPVNRPGAPVQMVKRKKALKSSK